MRLIDLFDADDALPRSIECSWWTNNTGYHFPVIYAYKRIRDIHTSSDGCPARIIVFSIGQVPNTHKSLQRRLWRHRGNRLFPNDSLVFSFLQGWRKIKPIINLIKIQPSHSYSTHCNILHKETRVKKLTNINLLLVMFFLLLVWLSEGLSLSEWGRTF